MYYSQYGQDRYLHQHYFVDINPRTFIEIGANDGITLSNTYFFEKELGWKGVCVEPIPSAFQKLSQNRTSLNLNWCIAQEQKPAVDFLVVEGYAEMLSGIHANYESTHLKRIDGYIDKEGGKKYITQIPTKTFMDIVELSGFTTIDYCSIDVEGAELDILRGIDFNAVDIKIFSIENNYGNKTTAKLMRKNGYRLVCKLGDDEIFEKSTVNPQQSFLAKIINTFKK